MRRLFWRIFAIVWLTMATSLALLFVISFIFGVLPIPQELSDQKTNLAIDTAAALLATNGVGVTQQYLTAVSTTPSPVHLKLTVIGHPLACKAETTDQFERRIVNTGRCYQLTAAATEIDFLARNLPKLVPWTSAMLAAAVTAFWLAQYLTRPVDQLRRGLRALAQGQFDIRIGGDNNRKRDEVEALAHDFDVTAARLQEFQDIQQRLFHDVSHELRSPLSRLQAAIGLMKQNPGRLQAMADRLEREIARMDDLVGEVLTLARLTAGDNHPLERQTVDLVDLLQEIVDDCAFEGASRNVRVVYEGAKSFVTSVNGELIYRAIENVVRNAVKYSPSNTRVAVFAERAGQTFVITVLDQGPGIAKDSLAAIFQPFRRGNDIAEGTSGFGLGLAITKHAFASHSGHVEVELPANGGLLMRMTLPA
ncbi:ATP-binding protein [Rhizobium sp. HT1-10]|uniref:HAMP domain-containing sensor histidine kinase n=1 Tax=Rhizobium sp. HT1-10 TaxID=3111638 RepID=UPI003C1C9F2B